jgi:hypothetical protein
MPSSGAASHARLEQGVTLLVHCDVASISNINMLKQTFDGNILLVARFCSQLNQPQREPSGSDGSAAAALPMAFAVAEQRLCGGGVSGAEMRAQFRKLRAQRLHELTPAELRTLTVTDVVRCCGGPRSDSSTGNISDSNGTGAAGGAGGGAGASTGQSATAGILHGHAVKVWAALQTAASEQEAAAQEAALPISGDGSSNGGGGSTHESCEQRALSLQELTPENWDPRILILNLLHCERWHYRARRMECGDIHYKYTIQGTFGERFQLHRFPFDRWWSVRGRRGGVHAHRLARADHHCIATQHFHMAHGTWSLPPTPPDLPCPVPAASSCTFACRLDGRTSMHACAPAAAASMGWVSSRMGRERARWM